MSKNKLITDIINEIKIKVELSKTGLYACELSSMILIYNPSQNILYKLQGFKTLAINDENISEIELMAIHMEVKHKYENL